MIPASRTKNVTKGRVLELCIDRENGRIDTVCINLDVETENEIGILRSDGVLVGVAPGFGGSSHVAILKLARAAHIEPGKLTIVPFKGANESVLSVLGGHTDVAIGTMSILAPQLASGNLRAIAIAAPKRLGGSQSNIPTWKEQGVDVVEGNWRGVVGPKDLGEAEVAFWSSKLAEAVKNDEWVANLERNHWDADFITGAEAKHFLDFAL